MKKQEQTRKIIQQLLKENIRKIIKFLPEGSETAPYPQVVTYYTGMYHIEVLGREKPGYLRTNPFKWTTHGEEHMNARFLDKEISALVRARIMAEAHRNG